MGAIEVMSLELTRRGFLGSALGGVVAANQTRTHTQRPNVIFVSIDDLRCELGCYGRAWMRTPNIDRLARSGVTFANAYCQIAVCSPSRTSVMTGLRPDQTKIYDLRTHFRKHLPDAVTLPQHFKEGGYLTTGFSKIYHLGNHTPGGLDDPASWSEPSWHPGGPRWGTRACRSQATEHQFELKRQNWTCDIALAGVSPGKPGATWEVPAVESMDLPDDRFTDGQTTDAVLNALDSLGQRPFFLGVGYLNPHLPFNAPRRFFDLYPAGSERLPRNPKPPSGAPEFALHNWGELRQYSDIGWQGDLPEPKARELIRGYCAATSFVDAQVGRLMEGLEKRRLLDNTIVVLWGDNGYHLGEHGLWCKHSNFEEATHVPLIIRLPGGESGGTRVEAPVELLDIYPTLCDLAGLSVPAALAGRSLAPLCRGLRESQDRIAWSQFPRVVRGKGEVMGYSLRSSRYRYTEWRYGREVRARELYDYREDPYESVNLASKGNAGSTIRELSRLMQEGPFRG